MKTIKFENSRRGSDWTGQIISADWMLSYNDYRFELTEMPKKGQRKVKRCVIITFGSSYRLCSDLIVENIIAQMELNDEESYEDVKNLIVFALYRSRDLFFASDDYKTAKFPVSLHVDKGFEQMISAKEIIPEDAKELTIKGKDFSMKINWSEFSAFDPNSDFESMDPHYSVYKSKTHASARKMYKLAADNKNLFSDLTYNQLDAWLSSKRIAHELQMSCWH